MNARSLGLLMFASAVSSCHADRPTETGMADALDLALHDGGGEAEVVEDSGVEQGGLPDTSQDGGADPDRDAGSGQCPAEAPISQACGVEGLRCEYGTECCCGQCYPSLVCECHGGLFGCYYTDACLIPGCPDVADAQDPGDSGGSDPGDPGNGHDTGQAVECGSFPPVFPDFDESCQEDQDCVVVFHQVNCCGTQGAWGIAASAQAAFHQAEEVCRSQFPACGCPAFATEADDGNTAWDAGQFAVRCRSGECFSFVEGAAPPCHDANDCDAGQICLAPGEPLPCGVCREPEPDCATDDDCGPAQVCEWVTGACLCRPAMQCVTRCDLPLRGPLSPCKPGEACVDGHCAASACVADTDCPWLFWCDPTAQTCARRTCGTDADCEGGRCVKGACYDSLGTCSYIPP